MSKDNRESLADEIGRVADALELISKNKFNRKLLTLYIQDKTKLGKQKIDMVLDAIEEFSTEYRDETEEE